MCETFPTLNMPLDMLCIPYKKKLLWSKSYLKLSNVPNLVALVQILWNFSFDVPVSKQLWRPRFLIGVINANDRISRVKPADVGQT
jgi:hypothetical protein